MWRDMSFVTQQFPEKPDWLVDNKQWICEGVSDRWIINKGDENIFYYNIKEEK